MQDESWSDIRELAVSAANADTDHEKRVYFGQILEKLAALEARYGTQPILLSIRADYTTDPVEERRLLKESYSLALERSEDFCARLSATSLANHYLHRGLNVEEARYWLTRARECQPEGEDDDVAELDSLDRMIAGLESDPKGS